MTGRVIHVGLPIRCANTIERGNFIHIDGDTFVVVKVGGAAFDMIPTSVCATCGASPDCSVPDNTDCPT